MTISTSHLAYGDCYEAMDRALTNSRGVRVAVADMDAATFLRMRMHQARVIDRRRKTEIYPEPDHPLHGASPYDKLVVRLRNEDGRTWVYIEQVSGLSNEIEPLGEELAPTAEPIPEPEEILEVSEPEPTEITVRRV